MYMKQSQHLFLNATQSNHLNKETYLITNAVSLPFSLLGTEINFKLGIYFICHFGGLIIIRVSLGYKNNKPFPFIILHN